MKKAAPPLPDDDLMAVMARTKSFSEIEDEYGIVQTRIQKKRYGYPVSSYYRLSPTRNPRKRKRVIERFLRLRRSSGGSVNDA